MELEKKYIHAGQLYIGVNPTEITTVLGSCVAVCLVDQIKNIAGMNHYLMPLWNGEGLKSLKYGNVSINKLIEDMIAAGSNKRHIVAKIFGGASPNQVTHESLMIGKKNIMVCENILEEHRISIVAKDIGGIRGRRIALNSVTGKITLKYAGGK